MNENTVDNSDLPSSRLHPEGLVQVTKEGRLMEWRGGGTRDGSGRNITLPCLLDHCRYSRGCLLHFSTVPPYLLLKQPDESFMHRKLKNTVGGVVDEGGDKRKKRGRNEGGEVIEETKGDGGEVREAD